MHDGVGWSSCESAYALGGRTPLSLISPEARRTPATGDAETTFTDACRTITLTKQDIEAGNGWAHSRSATGGAGWGGDGVVKVLRYVPGA